MTCHKVGCSEFAPTRHCSIMKLLPSANAAHILLFSTTRTSSSCARDPKKVAELIVKSRPIKNPVDQGLQGFRMWRPKPESNRRGRICKPMLKSFITATCRLFGVPLVGDFQCLAGRIPPRRRLRLWTQKIIYFTALFWLSKTQDYVPIRLVPHSS